MGSWRERPFLLVPLWVFSCLFFPGNSSPAGWVHLHWTDWQISHEYCVFFSIRWVLEWNLTVFDFASFRSSWFQSLCMKKKKTQKCDAIECKLADKRGYGGRNHLLSHLSFHCYIQLPYRIKSYNFISILLLIYSATSLYHKVQWKQKWNKCREKCNNKIIIKINFAVNAEAQPARQHE